MTERNLSIRLSVKDQDTVKRALEALGKDGQAAMKRIEEGSKPASAGLLAVNAASQEVQAGLSGLSGRAGAAGSVLSAMGPAGMVAAAGIGAVAAGLTVAISRSRQATETFASVAQVADRLGVTTTRLQELRFATDRAGAGAEAADEAIKELGIRASEAAAGSGEAVEGFKRLGISQDQLRQGLSDTASLFELVINRTAQLSTTAEQAYTLDKIFGDIGGEAFTALTAQGADGLARLRQEAHDLGVVVDERVLRKAKETNAELKALSSTIDTNLNQALVDLAPIVVAGTNLLAGFAAAVRDIADASRNLENRTVRGIEAEIERNRSLITAMQKQDDEYPDFLEKIYGNNKKEIAAAEARIRELQAELDRRAENVTVTSLRARTDTAKRQILGDIFTFENPTPDYDDGKTDTDPVKDAKARFQRAAQSFAYTSNTWDQERATRDSLDQTARELMEYANKLREPQRKMLEEQAKDVQRLIEANTKAQVANITRVGDAIDRSLQDNLSKAASRFQSWGDSVRAIIADVASELIRMYTIQKTGGSIGGWIAQGINAWVGSMGGGTTPGTVMAGNTSGAGYFGARDFGGLTTAGGPRAAGGQVFPGSVYLVNERRAEDSTAPGFFMPIRPGVIHPESQGGGGGGGVALTQQFNLSVSGGTAAEIQQLRAMVDDMAATFGARTVAALAQARRTGTLRNIGL